MRDLPTHLARVAATQRGHISRVQAHRAGANDSGLRRLVQAGVLVRVRPGVFRFAGTTPAWIDHVAAAVLAAGVGAVASHHTALALWAVEGVRRATPIHVSIDRMRRHDDPDVVCHQVRDLARDTLTSIDSVPVTSLLRSILDVSARSDVDTVADLLASARRMHGTSRLAATWVLRQHAKKGRPGIRVFRAAVAQEFLHRATDSDLEQDGLRLLLRAGLPEPVVRYVTTVDSTVVEVDLAWPEQRAGIEWLGGDHHQRSRVWRKDRRRHNHYELAGWRILEYEPRFFMANPEVVVAEVTALLGCALHPPSDGNAIPTARPFNPRRRSPSKRNRRQ